MNNMDIKPQYAHYFKCDLHMHTPLDSHWRDASTRLRKDDSDERKREVARIYLKACHSTGLEVVAITDHNFAESPEISFIKYLQEENDNVAKECHRDPLYIFPGFELEADVGKGCHLLCIFPSETPLNVVDSRLTSLELPPDKRYNGELPKPSTVQMKDVLKVVQRDLNYTGIIIAPHPTNAKGIFDNDRISEWLQKEEYKNIKLLCLEIPKPIEKMSRGWQSLLLCNEECQDEWKRERPPACVMSSDCYRLYKDNAEDSNYIGYQYTWIKMSRPSVESLRQAFLDWESRIRFGPNCPDEQFQYPKIRSILVRDASFLRRAERINWSPNLNCLIGSRGTGKSTLLDYMRLALDRLRPEDLPITLRDEVESRVKDTLIDQKTYIEVDIEAQGGCYRIAYSNENGGSRKITSLGGEIIEPQPDIRILFPCRILSQREIDHSVGKRDRNALRKFLDDFVRSELDELDRMESRIRSDICQIDASIDSKERNQKDRIALQTEKLEIESYLEKQKEKSEILPLWQKVEYERNFFDNLHKDIKEIDLTFTGVIKKIELKNSSEMVELEDCPNKELVLEMKSIAENAVRKAIESVSKTAEAFSRETTVRQESRSSVIYNLWHTKYSEIHKKFLDAQVENNIKDDGKLNIEDAPQRLLDIKDKLSILDKEKSEIEGLKSTRFGQISQLRSIWENQTKVREEKAEELMNRLRPSKGCKPYVEVHVEHQSDIDEVIKLLEGKIPNKRRLNRDDIKGIMDRLQSEPSGQFEYNTILIKFIREVRKGEGSEILRDGLSSDNRRRALLEAFDEGVLNSLELVRIPDRIVYYVYRRDGTLAGAIDKVSAGQQGTAILNLLLASGTEPLVVDTPEEGLDNEGVYTELVPIFRREKEKRQIIIVTHNANIPVNADAEEIIALEATGYILDEELEQIVNGCNKKLSRDQIKHLSELLRWPDWEAKIRKYLSDGQRWEADVIDRIIIEMGNSRQSEARIKYEDTKSPENNIAVGALDVETVKHAVQNIMEGSEKAFKRRREKYGF